MSSSPKSRRKARRAAMQALYQWQLTRQAPAEVVAQFHADEVLESADRAYFDALLDGVVDAADELDEHLAPLLDRPVAQLDPVERAILRIAAFELVHRSDVPWRVVIDEAVDLAHVFGAEQSHRYVNGVLDALARQVRREALEQG